MPYINPTTPEGFYQLVDKRAEEGNIDWLVHELKERMRVNVGLLAENTSLNKKFGSARREIQMELFKRRAEETAHSYDLTDDEETTHRGSFAKAIEDAIAIVGRVLPE